MEAITLASLVVTEQDFTTESWRFCRTGDCSVAYFSDRNQAVPVSDVRVRVSQKETHADRPVCYCFGYSARDVQKDGAGLIPADIAGKCRRGEDRCEETNPQGGCCLGNVLAAARESKVPR